jgi:peptidoglycan lytic transglycosylase G
MNKRKIILSVIFVTILISGVISYKIYSAIFSSNTLVESEYFKLTIPTNTSKESLLKIISPSLKNKNTFELVAQRKGYFENIRPGVYTLINGMSNNEIINKLRLKSEGVNVTFNNTNSLEELASRISKQIEADSTSLIHSFKDVPFLKQYQFNEDDALSMYIPNTYKLYWNTSGVEFRNRMLNEYHRYWNTSRLSKAKKLNLTPTMVYSLASIVNKESIKVDERPRIAGVYINLLRNDDKLRADPTVIYALKKVPGNSDLVIKRVLYKDLKIDSPYNTYKYKGVPPGPICMPDMSSLEAVLNPENHSYNFFVVDVDNFGYHVFASTLEQHNLNKKKYINWINEQKIYR